MSRLHYVISVVCAGGATCASYYGTLTPEPDATRGRVFTRLLDGVKADLATQGLTYGHISFFSLEPDALPARAGGEAGR